MGRANGSNGQQQSKAMVTGPRQKIDTLRSMFERSKSNIQALLPKHLDAEKLTKIVLSAASRTPELLDCSPQSILLASMQSASLGLEPNTPLQVAYLVPYWNRKTNQKEAQFIPGYRGLITLAVQSGAVLSVQARAVHANDLFEVSLGTDEHIKHVPDLEDPGELRAVYAVAKLKTGEVVFEVMTLKEVERIKNLSKASKFGPWVDHFEEMARKTVIRRLAKNLPMRTDRDEFVRALDHQARAEAGEAPDYGDVIDTIGEVGSEEEPASEPSRSDSLSNRLQQRAEDADFEEEPERQPGED